MMRNKNMRRVTLLVTAQTAWHIKNLSKIARCSQGCIVDKLVRDRMVSLKEGRNSGTRNL